VTGQEQPTVSARERVRVLLSSTEPQSDAFAMVVAEMLADFDRLAARLASQHVATAQRAAATYPRLTVSPDRWGGDTVWLERHLGDAHPVPWINSGDLAAPVSVSAKPARVLWERLTAGTPCSLAAYQEATAALAAGNDDTEATQ